jgi:hypothetical protein
LKPLRTIPDTVASLVDVLHSDAGGAWRIKIDSPRGAAVPDA